MSVSLYIGPTDVDFNLSNTNFLEMCNVLHISLYTDDGLVGEIAGADLRSLRTRILFFLEDHASQTRIDVGLPVTIRKPVDGPTIIDCGRRPNYFRERITQLLVIVDRALESGKPLRYA